MNYPETIQWLYTQLPMFQRVGPAAYKADLGNIVALCAQLGNPQKNYPTIHIAGTNGKGSVAHMMASVLQESGFKTGLFTSPHLVDFRERIRINGVMIPEEAVTDFVASAKDGCETIKPSFFELTTAMAFDHFAQESVDIAVIETGMGGRLDSTNIITPVVSVITNIGIDHQQFLGSTLKQIAIEKAGIIKPDIPVVVGETQESIAPLFIGRARESGSPIWFADQMPPGIGLQKSLPGAYQHKNRQTVSGVVVVLRLAGWEIEDDALLKGIGRVVSNTGIRGRWELLNEYPLTICDVGHNEAGIREVVEQIHQTPHQQLHFVFGTVNDKDPQRILQLLPNEAIYYFCKADIPRGMDADVLANQAASCNLKGKAYPTVRGAYETAKANAAPNDLIFIGGSTFVVGEIMGT